MSWSEFASGTLRTTPCTFPHLLLIYIAVSLFSEHFEAKEANPLGQGDISGGLAHGQLPGAGSMFPRMEIPGTEAGSSLDAVLFAPRQSKPNRAVICKFVLTGFAVISKHPFQDGGQKQKATCLGPVS